MLFRSVSMKKEEVVEDEEIDLEKALAETKPNLEIAEAGEEKRSKKPARKKPAPKKKVEAKAETKEDAPAEENK